MKENKFYYYDEGNDLLKYTEGHGDIFAHWINPYLTLMFPMGCTELTPENVVGFQIDGVRTMMHKAEEQASIPLTPEQEREMEEAFIDMGWTHSVNADGERIWTKEK